MNRLQADNWKKFLDRLDRRYVGSIYKALRLQYARFAEMVRTYGPEAAKGIIATDFVNSDIAPIIQDIYKDAAVFMANYTLRGLNKEPKRLKYRGFGYNEEWVRQIQEYFRLYLLNKSVFPINQTTRDRVLEVLNKGIEEGWGVDEMAAAINNLPQIRNRAQMIVRTETVRAANFGTFLGAEKFDYEVEKEWLAINDNRTRHNHRNVDGQTKDPSEPFSNGLMFPGDPNGSPENVINCRCSMAWVPKRDENGRLIMKKPKPAGVTASNFATALSAGITAGSLLYEVLNQD